jgi:hypothetical protein
MSNFSSRCHLVAASLYLLTTAGAAAADEIWLTGAEGSSNNASAYIGRVAPLPGSQLGNGWISRLSADWTRYEYDNDGVTVEARGPSAEVALAYQRSNDRYWWSLSGGLVYRHTSLSPDDPDAETRGNQAGLKLQAEGETTLFGPAWRVGGNLSYVLGVQSYSARGRIMREISPGRRIGVEAMAQGDPDYRSRQAGVVMAVKVSKQAELGFKVGIRKTAGLEEAGYFGVELNRSY